MLNSDDREKIDCNMHIYRIKKVRFKFSTLARILSKFNKSLQLGIPLRMNLFINFQPIKKFELFASKKLLKKELEFVVKQ